MKQIQHRKIGVLPQEKLYRSLLNRCVGFFPLHTSQRTCKGRRKATTGRGIPTQKILHGQFNPNFNTIYFFVLQ